MPRLSQSASSADPEPRLAFGEFELDVPAGSLRRGDEIVPLRPKTWAVLRILAERAGRLVTNRELLDAVWADTAVTPNVLTNVIGELRVALGDRSQPARYVQTVHRRGYRFVAEVRQALSPRPPRTHLEQPSSPGGTSAGKQLFVGREAELDALRGEWERVTAGERRLAFVAGVPDRTPPADKLKPVGNAPLVTA